MKQEKMKLKFTCNNCNNTGYADLSRETQFTHAHWYTDQNGLKHNCIYCRSCGAVHDAIGSLFGRILAKDIVTFEISAFKKLAKINNPDFITLTSVHPYIIKAMVEDGRLNEDEDMTGKKPTLDFLLGCLKDKNFIVRGEAKIALRRNAAIVLGDIGDSTAIKPLNELLTTEKWEHLVREEAAIEIARGEQVEAVGRLSLWQVLFIATIGVLIAVCEWVFAYQNVAYGIAIALGLAVLIYVMLSSLRFEPRITNCGESLALIPLYILFTSSLPWFFINEQYLLPAVYSVILGLCLWHVYQRKLSLKRLLGFSKEKLLKYSLVGLAIGIVLGTGEYFILNPSPAFPTFEVKYLLRDMVYMLLFVGLGEELLFRGLIQQDLMRAFGWKWGLIGASLLFAIMHLTWRSMPELGFVFIAGLILGFLYWKTKSLVAPIVAHGINNVILVSVLPYLLA